MIVKNTIRKCIRNANKFLIKNFMFDKLIYINEFN